MSLSEGRGLVALSEPVTIPAGRVGATVIKSAASVERLHERPQPAFTVARAVLAVAVGLVDGLVINRCAVLRGVAEVGVHVVDHHGNARGRSTQRSRRRQPELRGLGMKPHHTVPRLQLPMDNSTLVVTGELSRAEAENPHEVVVSARGPSRPRSRSGVGPWRRASPSPPRVRVGPRSVGHQTDPSTP